MDGISSAVLCNSLTWGGVQGILNPVFWSCTKVRPSTFHYGGRGDHEPPLSEA